MIYSIFQDYATFLLHLQKNNWQSTLDADKAGAASNAEDFTKQFMSQMFGNGGAGTPSAIPPNEAPPPVPVAKPGNFYFDFFACSSNFMGYNS